MVAPAFAGPCTDQIYQADIAIGKRLDAAAAQGKSGPQSNFATLHRQPTPSTVAGAEAQARRPVGRGLAGDREFMDEARKADAASDRAGCQKALAEAQKILAP